MSGERQPRGKRAHLKDFFLRPDGEVEYTGAYVSCPWEPDRLRGELRRLLAMAAAGAGASLLVGCLPDTGMEGCFYLLLPYAAGFLAICRVLWLLATLYRYGTRLRRYQAEKTLYPLQQLTAFGLAAAGIGLAGFLYACIKGTWSGADPGGALYPVSQGLLLLVCLTLHRRLGRIPFSGEEDSGPSQY